MVGMQWHGVENPPGAHGWPCGAPLPGAPGQPTGRDADKFSSLSCSSRGVAGAPLQTIVSAAEVLVALQRPWLMLNASQEFLDLFQLASDSEKKPLAVVVGPNTESARIMKMLEAASHGQEMSAVLVLYGRTGQEGSYHVHAKPFGSPLNPSGCLFSIISAEARSQAAAAAEDGRVKVVVDAASFRVSHVSAAFADMYGLPASLVLGRTLNVIHGPGTDLSKWRSMLSQSSKGIYVKDTLVTVMRDCVQMNNVMELRPVVDQHGYVSHVLVEVVIDASSERMQCTFPARAVPEAIQAQHPGRKIGGHGTHGWMEEQAPASWIPQAEARAMPQGRVAPHDRTETQIPAHQGASQLFGFIPQHMAFRAADGRLQMPYSAAPRHDAELPGSATSRNASPGEENEHVGAENPHVDAQAQAQTRAFFDRGGVPEYQAYRAGAQRSAMGASASSLQAAFEDWRLHEVSDAKAAGAHGHMWTGLSKTGSREDSAESVSTVMPRRKPGQANEVRPVHITLDMLERCANMSLVKASIMLGISPTSMKKTCRRLGIMRWPPPVSSNEPAAPPQIDGAYVRRIQRKHAASMRKAAQSSGAAAGTGAASSPASVAAHTPCDDSFLNAAGTPEGEGASVASACSAQNQAHAAPLFKFPAAASLPEGDVAPLFSFSMPASVPTVGVVGDTYTHTRIEMEGERDTSCLLGKSTHNWGSWARMDKWEDAMVTESQDAEHMEEEEEFFDACDFVSEVWGETV